MLSISPEKLDQVRRDIRERKDKRNSYVRNWREGQRVLKRQSIFVKEYVRIKFVEVHSEAMKFYSTLDQAHPEKKDLLRTQEFRSWRATFNNNNNNKKKSTAVTCQTVQQPIDNMILNIPLLPLPSATQLQASVEPTVQSQPEIPPETVDMTTVELQLVTPPEIGAETTVEMPIEMPHDFEITDSRIQEIIAELNNDPDLGGIFNNSQIDEGIEVPSLMEDIEADLGSVEDDIFW